LLSLFLTYSIIISYTIFEAVSTFELDTSLKHLKLAHSYIHKIVKHNDNDIDILKEIVSLCKILKNDIESKGDGWSL